MTSDDKIPLLNESMSEDDKSLLDQSMSEETSQWDRSMSEERKPITVQPRAQEVRIPVGIERGRLNVTNERQNDENRRFTNDQVNQALRNERLTRRLERKRQEGRHHQHVRDEFRRARGSGHRRSRVHLAEPRGPAGKSEHSSTSRNIIHLVVSSLLLLYSQINFAS
uniref:BZIP domain-containing protein n=1 Tax=Trichogramma kaykai TaxID=54128 RepID=A0ABD2VT64_9HYME